MGRPRVLLDVDGVLADFMTPCLGVLRELTGKTYLASAVTSWDIMKALDVPEDVAERAYSAMNRGGYCRGLPVYPGAQAGVAALAKIADIYAVTSPLRGPFWAHERELWLEEHFGIPSNRVVSTSAKYLCAGDVIVDDRTSTLVKWRKHHSHGVPVRWDTAHNANDAWDGLHTSSWAPLCAIVQRCAVTAGVA